MSVIISNTTPINYLILIDHITVLTLPIRVCSKHSSICTSKSNSALRLRVNRYIVRP